MINIIVEKLYFNRKLNNWICMSFLVLHQLLFMNWNKKIKLQETLVVYGKFIEFLQDKFLFINKCDNDLDKNRENSFEKSKISF